ncbi:VOC family protein [Aestuariicella hydrocarbonica]|uniref:VOC family protein n=1 Tax=Pseudomaricurvus hydrocarbonicus TaxID=1470433 RepID=A0A9E5MMR4_9GAMM|nr:VOC family protein [Aestuariicella hydrocarbonica]NHO67104.1 VOC family protein [Aestuariicella hydrocarbonica]
MKHKQLILFITGFLGLFGAFTDVLGGDAPDAHAELRGQLTGVIVQASNIERSIDFYTGVIGLKTVGRVERDGKLVEIMLSSSGKFLDGMMLTLQVAKAGGPAVAEVVNKAGSLIFMVPSNDFYKERLTAAGYSVREEDVSHLYSSDPDGYPIMFYQLDPRILSSVKKG